jgi:hypothetical protein
MYDDFNSRAAAIEASVRQMQRKELIRFFRLAVSALGHGARRLARIGAAAAVHGAVTVKDRETPRHSVRP